ncbi:MAG: hypothetical protein KDI38_24465 [Calditrichaeota bacterium]|nr:hypothetical protein [Calditrichota bacterium]MCB0317084.1 hypothetical protein [Calditrichota bacterium]
MRTIHLRINTARRLIGADLQQIIRQKSMTFAELQKHSADNGDGPNITQPAIDQPSNVKILSSFPFPAITSPEYLSNCGDWKEFPSTPIPILRKQWRCQPGRRPVAD